MKRKYEFTGETIEYRGRELKRIARVEDGMIGGYIENEDNLSHDGGCFVYDNATVYGDAKVFGDAEVYSHATVCGNARVYGDAEIYGYATVSGDARVYGDAEISEGCIDRGEIQVKSKEIEFHSSANSKTVAAIKKLDDGWVFNVGCQKLISKEMFRGRIYNTDGGIEENKHREFYLKILKLY